MCSSLFSPLRISIFPSVQEDVGLQLFPRCSPLLEIIHHPRGVQRSPSIRIFVQLNQHRVIMWPAMPPRCFPPSWKQGPRFAAIDLSRQCRSGVHVAKNWFTDYTSILFRLQARKLWHCSRPNMSVLCWITIKKNLLFSDACVFILNSILHIKQSQAGEYFTLKPLPLLGGRVAGLRFNDGKGNPYSRTTAH